MTEKEAWVGAGEVTSVISVDTGGLEHPDGETRELLDEIPPGMNYQYFTEKMGHPDPQFEWRSKFSDYLRKSHPEDPIKTVVARPGHRTGPFHWSGRRFHVRELAVLSSFPEVFELPEATTKAREALGNAVPPSLAKSVVKVAVGDESGVSPEELPSPRRGRTSHQTYRRRTENRLREVYGEGILTDD